MSVGNERQRDDSGECPDWAVAGRGDEKGLEGVGRGFELECTDEEADDDDESHKHTHTGAISVMRRSESPRRGMKTKIKETHVCHGCNALA